MTENEPQQQMDEVNVFVKYLPGEMKDVELRRLFSTCGDVVSAKVMMDSAYGSSLGYGFVRFRSTDAARKALELSGLRISNKVIRCKLSKATIYPELSTNLYIKPLPLDFTEEHLVQLFSTHGPIVSAKILTDKRTGESKQIAFVKFQFQSSATAAVETMNGAKVTEDSPGLIVKYAESDMQRDIRKAIKYQKKNSKNSSPEMFYPTYYVPNEVPQVHPYFYPNMPGVSLHMGYPYPPYFQSIPPLGYY